MLKIAGAWRECALNAEKKNSEQPPIGAIVRVPAADIEAVVSKALGSNTAAVQASSADQPSIRPMVARIEVRNSHLALWLMHPGAEGADESAAPPAPIEENFALLQS